MALTSDQTARLAAAQIDYEYRIFIGGPRGSVAEQDVTEGQTYTATASTTLASAWDGESTTIVTLNASGFTTSGAAYIAGSGNYLSKWIEYTGKSGNNLTGVTIVEDQSIAFATDTKPTPGNPSGATISQFVEITDYVTGLDYAEQADAEIGTWQAMIHGYNYNSRTMGQNHSVLALARFWPAPAESEDPAFVVLFHGYIAAGTTSDDWQDGKRFSLPVRPIDLYLENADAPGRRYGLSNLADGASTQASTALTDASLIDHSYEVIGNPSLAAGQAVDGSLDTIYVSNNIPSRTAENDPAGDKLIVGEAGFGPTGTGANGAYFVIWAAGNQDIVHYFIATAPSRNDGVTLGQNITAGSPSGSSATLTLSGTHTHLNSSNGFLRIATTGEEIRYDEKDGATLTGIERGANGTTAAAATSGDAIHNERILYRPAGEIANGDRIIFCKDRETLESWANVEDAEIVEWRTLNNDFDLTQAGDVIRIRGPLDLTVVTKHAISWGSEADTGFPGGSVGYGQAVRCINLASPDTGANFTITDEPVPGQNWTRSSHAYLSVEIPQFSIALDGAIDSSQTTIPVTPSTAGLTQAGGRIQVDSEQIDYTGITESGGTVELTGCTRGAASTTPAAHSDATQVYQVEDAIAHRNERISRIGWKRKTIYDGSPPRVVDPAFFEIWISTLASPTTPQNTDATDTTFRADWDRIFDVNGHYWIEWYTPPAWTGARVRHAMIVIQEMSDGGRAIINEFEAYRHGDTDPAPEALNSAGEMVEYILTNDFGLDATQVQIHSSGVGPIRDNMVNARARYLDLLREIARLTGGVIHITRDNTVLFYPSPWHPLGSNTGLNNNSAIAYEFGRTDTRRVTVNHGQRNRISQIQLTARNPDTGSDFLVQYPNTARALGSSVEVERSFYGAGPEARQLAEYLYRQANAQREITLIPVGHADGLRLFDRITLTWNLDAGNDLFSGRNFIITGISLSLSNPITGPKAADWAITAREFTT